MSVLLKLVYDTNLLRQRYVEIHENLFRLSLGRLVRRSGASAGPDYGAQAERLGRLIQDLQSVRDQLGQLDEGKLSHRTGRELRNTLADYTVALEDSIRKLQFICERNLKQQQGVAAFKDYSLGDYRLDRIAYDDAIQHHKRLGLRLNQLLSNF
jgi:hypothetical protein